MLKKTDSQIFIISAPSGAGKTSLNAALVEQIPDLKVSISHTTRPPRTGEIDGDHYHFVDDDTFNQMIEQGEFIEFATVFSYRYGTSIQAVQSILDAGNDVILEIDYQGATAARKYFKDTVSVFILPPSLQHLRNRLSSRNQDSEEVMRERLQEASDEVSHSPEYDFIVINDDFNTALDDLTGIIRATRLRQNRQSAKHSTLIESLICQ